MAGGGRWPSGRGMGVGTDPDGTQYARYGVPQVVVSDTHLAVEGGEKVSDVSGPECEAESVEGYSGTAAQGPEAASKVKKG